MARSPNIACPKLPAFDPTDLHAVQQAFQSAAPCRLQQSWRGQPEAEFAPATVRAGWRDDTLLLLAELRDADIFTFARNHNERLWELGDTLEVFLRPEQQQAYVEFHVAPNNLRLQLRFPHSVSVNQARENDSFGEMIIQEEIIRSHTWLRPDAVFWHALLEIPAKAVCDIPSLAGAEWRFSVCRYDYTRGQPTPVISSTSAHTQPDFHRQEEWGTLRFQN